MIGKGFPGRGVSGVPRDSFRLDSFELTTKDMLDPLAEHMLERAFGAPNPWSNRHVLDTSSS
jgi:hypothetical protein